MKIIIPFLFCFITWTVSGQVPDYFTKIDNNQNKDTLHVMLSETNPASQQYGLGKWTKVSRLITIIDSLLPLPVLDHGTLTGLLDDDHTQYALLAGRSGGQTLTGGTGITDALIFKTTSGVGASGSDMKFLVGNNGATESMTILNTGRIGIMNNAPTAQLHLGRSDGDILFGDNAFPGKQVSTDGGIEFSDSGRLKGGLFTEVDNAILTYGINAVPILGIGGRDNTKIGGMFRLDTRAGQNYFAVIRYPIGTDNYQFDLGLNSNGDMVLYNVVNSTPSASTKLHIMMSTSTTLPLQEIENISTGDAALQFSIAGDSYAMGIDNSDNDLFKISYNTSVGLATLGTNDLVKLDATGQMTVTGDVTVPDEVFGVGWNGVLEVPTKNAVYDIVSPLAIDALVVHKAGVESITGVKTFTVDPIVPDEAYTGLWDGSMEVPTKNAVFDYLNNEITSGYYSPTASDEINVDSRSVFDAQWIRVNNRVTVSGGFSWDPSSDGSTSFEIDLPFPSDLGDVFELSGSGASGELYYGSVQIKAETTNDTAEFIWMINPSEIDFDNHYYSYTFTYLIQ